jgi:hypothetical protein
MLLMKRLLAVHTVALGPGMKKCIELPAYVPTMQDSGDHINGEK